MKSSWKQVEQLTKITYMHQQKWKNISKQTLKTNENKQIFFDRKDPFKYLSLLKKLNKLTIFNTKTSYTWYRIYNLVCGEAHSSYFPPLISLRAYNKRPVRVTPPPTYYYHPADINLCTHYYSPGFTPASIRICRNTAFCYLPQ